MKRILSFILLALLLFSNPAAAAQNPSAYLKDIYQEMSIGYLTDMAEQHLYRLDYGSLYHLDKLLEMESLDLKSVIDFVREELLLSAPEVETRYSFLENSSAFTGRTALAANWLCLNYNGSPNGSIVAINTTSAAGYVSLALADAGIIGYDKGVLSDGSTDLSLTMALPFLVSSGCNEKQLGVSFIGMIPGEENETVDPEKNFFPGVAVRLILDRAANLTEARELMEQLQPKIQGQGFRLFLVEGNGGRSAVLECSSEGIHYINTPYALPDGPFAEEARNGALYTAFEPYTGIINKEGAFDKLSSGYLEEAEDAPVATQWSVLYDLRTLNITLTTEKSYEKIYHLVFINDTSC